MFVLRGLLIALACFVLGYFFFCSTSIQLVFHPDRYHGHNISRGIFFEGWYYKLVFVDKSNTLIVIPGVHMNDDNRHAFLMIAHENISNTYRFPFEKFQSSSPSNKFRVTIDGQNIFSIDELILDVAPKDGDNATESYKMNLTLLSNLPLPDLLSWFAPGTMGPYSWVPTMQCYHHVLSMRHEIRGSIQIGSDPPMDVSGVGYIEKDWGQAFPSMWIWGQANQWENLPASSTASLFFSFALIPWYFGMEFPGFLVAFEHNHQFYRFNTYLQSVVNTLSVNNETNELSFIVYDLLFEHKLSVTAHCPDRENTVGAMIDGPRNGRMEKYVKEILAENVYLDVRLSQLISPTEPTIKTTEDLNPFVQRGYRERVLFEGRAQHVALEIVGNVNWLSKQFQQTYEQTYPWRFSFVRTFVQHFKLIFSLLTTTFVASLILIFSRRHAG